MEERGIIRNEPMARILRDFSGLRFENGITPTDIDAFLEFDDKTYIIIEAKYKDKKLPWGQKIAFRRLADIIGKTHNSLLIFARHEVTPESGEKIKVGELFVVEYRTKKIWRKPLRKITVRKMIDEYRKSLISVTKDTGRIQ